MAIKIGQEFERTSKATRFKDDVMTKAQMLACTDDNYSDGYLVVEKDSHDLYIYDVNATPSAETGKFVKVETGSSNLPMTKTVLWELPQGAVINPDNITLSNPMSDYEQILIEGFVSSDGKDHIMSCLLMAEDLHTTNAVGLSDQEMRYVWYNVNSQTSLSKRIANGGILIYRIYGITFGSSLDGTIGRWEKIGEWKPNGPRSMVIPNLTEYNAFAVSSIVDTTLDRNDNTAMVTLAEWEVGTFVQSTTLSGQYFQVHRDNETTIRFEGTLYGNVYGYKETAISDADVQKIADATALKSTNMEALWNNGELKGMKLFQNDKDLRLFDDGLALIIDGNTTTRVNLTTKNYVDTEVAKKQDTLTAGTNITIDANNVISASGGGGGASLTIDTTQVGYGEATISEGGYNLSFTNQNGQGVRIGGISEDGEMVASKTYVDTEVAKKQNTLVSGTNIKTVNNQSLLGSGDIPIPTIVGSDWGVAKQGTVTVSGTTESTVSISDLNLTSASDYQVAITPSANTSNPSYINKSVASFTVKIADNSGNKTLYYTIFAKGYGSVPNGGTTGQALVKKSNTDGDVEWKTVGGESTIDKIKVNNVEQTITDKTVNIEAVQFNGTKLHGQYADATLSGGVTVSMDFTPTTDGMQYKTEYDDGIIHTTTKDLVDKTYVDSKSPTIVNEGATFTNALGNQKMQIRTGSTNSVIIKDTNGDGTTEYWSYELPDKDYVDTEIAKRNAVVNFDNEYKTLQIRDVDNNLDFQIVKETSNDYIRVNEYAEDDRGQMQQIFDVNLPTKTYVDTLTGDLSTLTTTDTSSLVNAINEVYEKSGEPFRVKNWASSWSGGVSIDPCTTDKTNANLSKMTYSIDAVEGADYQIVGMVAYEVFDNTSGGNRLNVWPVCQFTGNGQKELSVRWVCAGTTVKTAKRINAWVLLKHR